MTLPDERTRAVLYTRDFLLKLLDPKKTPKVPRLIRKEALRLLRHYPTLLDLKLCLKKGAKIFGKIKELTKI